MEQRKYTSYADIAEFYETVTSLLGTDTDEITQEDIDKRNNAPMSEKTIKSQVGNWADLIEEKLEVFEYCVILQTAINIYPQMRVNQVKIMQSQGIKVEMNNSYNISLDLQKQLDTMLNTIKTSNADIVTTDRKSVV